MEIYVITEKWDFQTNCGHVTQDSSSINCAMGTPMNPYNASRNQIHAQHGNLNVPGNFHTIINSLLVSESSVWISRFVKHVGG